MKHLRILVFFGFLLVLSGMSSCSTTNEVSSRRGLMMPEKSDLPRNSKYKPSKKKKTYGAQHKKKKNRKRR